MNTQPKYASWPVVGPLLLLFASQEVILALLMIGLNYLISLRPEIEASRLEMQVFISGIFTLIIGGQIAQRLQGYNAASFWSTALRPVSLLIKSRKFWVGVGTLIANIAVALLPETEPYREQMITAITLIGSVLIGSIAYEDGKSKEGLPPAIELPDLKASGPGALSPGVEVVPTMMLPAEEDFDRLVDAIEAVIQRRGHVIIPAVPKA